MSAQEGSMPEVGVMEKENEGVPSKLLAKRPAEWDGSKGEQAKRKAVLRPSTRHPSSNAQAVAEGPPKQTKPALMGPPPPRAKAAADADTAVRPVKNLLHNTWSRWTLVPLKLRLLR